MSYSTLGDFIRRLIYKIILIGDSLLDERDKFGLKVFESGFTQNYSHVVGANFWVKRVEHGGNEIVLQIWDLVNSERFLKVREVYFQGAAGAIFLYDIIKPDTFLNLSNLIDELMENNKRPVPFMIVGLNSSKRDQTIQAISKTDAWDYMSELAKWIRFGIPYFEFSTFNKTEIENFKSYLDLLLYQIETVLVNRGGITIPLGNSELQTLDRLQNNFVELSIWAGRLGNSAIKKYVISRIPQNYPKDKSEELLLKYAENINDDLDFFELLIEKIKSQNDLTLLRLIYAGSHQHQLIIMKRINAINI